MKKSFLLCLLMALLTPWVTGQAQETITLNGNISQALTPGGTYTFYDSGGASGNYGNSQNYTATFTSDGDITINFSSFATESSSGCSDWDHMHIYDGDATTGTLLARGQTGCSSATLVVNKNFVATSGKMTVVWKSDNGTNAAGWVATITVGMPPACPKPKNLAAAVTPGDGHKATLTWTGGASTIWNGEYGTNSGFDGAEPLYVDNGVPSVDLTGLTPETQYYVHIKADCGGDGESEYSTTFSFKTACDAKDAASWTDGFEGSIDCWMVGNLESTSSDYIPSIVKNYSHSEDCALKLNAYKYYYYEGYSYNTFADSAYAVLPAMDFGTKGLAGYTLKFYARQGSTGSSYYNHLFVGVAEDPFDMTTYTQIADVEVNGTSYALHEVPLSNPTGTAQYIVLMATVDPASSATTRYGQFYVDDIALEVTPTCQSLASISVSNIERRSVTINLNPKTGQELVENYDLVYSTVELDAAALETADIKKISGASKVISGLERETKYYIYVRANCGSEGVSEWVSAEATTKGLSACDEVPVGTGSSNAEYGPVCGFYGYERHGYIFTPEDGISAGSIAAMAWNYSVSGSAPAKIYIKNTNATAFETTLVWNELIADATLVYDATASISVGWNTVSFSAPFEYTGGNLMVLVASNYGGTGGGGNIKAYTTTSSNSASHFYVKKDSSIDDNAAYSTFSSKAIDGKRHNIKFTFCYALDACPAVTGLNCELVGNGTDKAHVSWTATNADYLSSYEAILSETEITDFSGAVTTHPGIATNELDLSGMKAGTHYYIYVRAVCKAEEHDDGSSDWVGAEFDTNASCPNVLNLAHELTDLNKVEITWDKAFAEQAPHFQYVLSETELSEADLNGTSATKVDDATSVKIGDLKYNQEYHVYVASVCNADHSAYEHVSFTTLEKCQAVTDLNAERIAHNLVELTWSSAQFATEVAWEAGIVGDEEHAQIVNERKAIIFGLQPSTSYQFYVKAKCSGSDISAAATLAETTAAEPEPCKQVGNGTSTTSYGPIYTYYLYSAYTQQLYKASEISGAAGGKITSIAFEHQGNSSNSDLTVTDYKIYMAETAEESLSTSWISEGLTEVFAGTTTFTHGTSGNWVSIDLDTPFEWDGEKNIVVAVYTPNAPTLSAGNYDSYFYGTSVTNGVVYKSSPSLNANFVPTSTGSSDAKRPNIKFCFEAKACPDVTKLKVDEESLSTTEATVSWEPMGIETAWNVFISENPVTDFSDLSGFTVENLTVLSKHFTGLEQGTDYYVYVQPDGCAGADFSEVHFQTIATCKKVMNLEAVAEYIKHDRATVTWDDNDHPVGTVYTVAYAKTDEFDLTDPAIATVTSDVNTTSAMLTGLEANTEYTFAVKAICSLEDESRWSETASFKTAYAVPFSEAFASSLPADWNKYTGLLSDVLGGAALTATTSGWSIGTANDIFANHAFVNIYGSGCKYWLVSPNIYLSQDNIQLTFDLALTLYGTSSTASPTDDDRFVVLISTDNGATWSILREWNNSGSADVYDNISTTGKLAAIDLSGYYNANPLNAVKIAFYGESTASGGDYNLHIDNVNIDVIPDCAIPTGLAIVENSITTEGASFTWDNIDGGAWKYAYALASEDEPADEAFVQINTNTVPVSGLTDNKDYIFYLRQVCGSAMSASVTKPFHTKQAPASVPYSTDFESGNDWMFINGELSNAWAYGEAAHNGEGTHAIYISNDNGASNAYTPGVYNASNPVVVYAVRLFHFEAGKYSFSYDWKANGESTYDYLRVALVPASDELVASTSLPSGAGTSSLPTGWIALDGGSKLNLKTDWQSFSSADLDIEEGDYNVVLLWRNDGTGGDQTPAAVDNFRIAKITCPKPSGVTVPTATVLYNAATVNWTAGGEESAWNLQYKASDASDWTLVSSENVTKPYTIQGLTTGTTYQVRVQAVCGIGDESDWTAAVSFTPTCKTPTLVTSGISNIGTTSADIAWTANGGEDTWNIQYKLSTDEEWTTISAITENPYTLDNLSAGKTYQVKVASASCEGTYSSAVSFNTECLAAYTIEDAEHPWRENFNGLTSGIPNCWDNNDGSTTTASYKWSYNADGHEGKCVRFDSYSNSDGNTNILKTPTIAVSQKLVLSFWYKNPVGGDFSVFYEINEEQQADALFSGLTGQSEWEQKEIILPAACVGKNVRILFQGTSNWGSTGAYIYLDDVEISLAPDCEKPTGLAVSDITTTSAQIAWTAGDGQTAWQICLNDDMDNLIEADATSFVLPSLTAATTYSIKVRAVCGGNYSDWSNAESFSTAICEDADKKSIRYELTDKYQDGWNGAYLKVVHKTTNIEIASLAVPGGQSTYTNNGTLDLCCGEEYSFVWESGSYDSECSFKIYDVQDEVILSHTQGASISAGGLLDYTMVCPACIKPSAISASDITANSATITWEASGQSQFNLRYKASDAADWTTVNNLTAATYALDELTQMTVYQVEVQATCNTEEWSNTYNFTTKQNIVNAPYATDFESGNDWMFINGELSNAWVYGEAAHNGEGTHALYISNDGGTTNEYTPGTSSAQNPVVVYATKLIHFDAGNYIFSYDWKADGESSYDYLRVALVPASVELAAGTSLPSGVGTTTLPTDWIALDGGSKLNQQTAWQSYSSAEMNIAGDYNVVLLWTNDGYSGTNPPAAFDNFSITKITCPMPNDVIVSNLIYNAADVNWTAGGEENEWNLRYKASDAADWTPVNGLTEASYSFNNLISGKTYQVQVQAVCDEVSQWTAAISFMPQCLAPTFGTDAVTNITTSSADIAWSAGNGEAEWTLKYKKASDAEWAEENVTGTPAFALSGLASGTTYQVKVASVCGTESDVKEFNTECEAITIDANHSYSQNFDALALNSAYTPSKRTLPACWSALNACTYSSYMYYPTAYYYAYTNYASSTPNALRFYSSYSSWSDYDPQDQYAVLPEMEGISGLRMRFNARAHETGSSYDAAFTIGVMTDPTDASTFVPVEAKAPAGTAYEAMEVRFNTYAGAGKHIAIKMEKANSTKTTRAFYIDDIIIDQIPECEEASGLAVVANSITASGASFTWDAEGGAWKYAYALASEDEPAVENFTAITTNSVAVSGLTDNSDYIFYLRRDCGSSVSPSISVPFQTEQLAVAVGNGWSDNFENGKLWKFVNGDCTNAWVYGEAAHNGEGTHAIYVSNDGGASNEYTNTLPALVYAAKKFTFGNGLYTFQYDWRANGESSYDVLFAALVPANTVLTATTSVSGQYSALPTGWTALHSGAKLNGKDEWQTVTTDEMNITAGDYMVVFAWRNDNSTGSMPAAIDNFSITKLHCMVPTGLTATAASANSINLAWTQGNEETAWNAQYRIGSGAWTTVALSDAVISGTSCSATLTGLEPQTTYEIQVQADCDDKQSSWSASATETTLCAAEVLPFSEDFNSLTSGIPACWNNAEGTTTAANLKWSYYATGHDGACVRFNSYNNALNNTNFLKTPAITITDAAATLRFWYKNPLGGDFSVLYALDGVLQETPLASGLTGAADWTEKSINLASCVGHDVVIIFKGTSNHNTTDNVNTFIYLDDVRVSCELVLMDTDNNYATLEAYKGKTVDVTLGRKFICTGYDDKEDHYNVICLPFSLSAEQLAASPIASDDLWEFKYSKVDDLTSELLFRISRAESIEAGKPYFIGLPELSENIVNPKFENVTIEASVGQQIGDPSVAQFCGNLVPEPFAAHDQSKLFIHTQTNTLYWWNGDYNSQLNSFRAFFNVNTDSGSGAPIFHGMPARFSKSDKEVTTGVGETEVEVDVQKIIENDHVVIIRNGVKYSIQGQLIR